MLELDKIDIQLLAALQHDGHATNPELGERVHLSASQVSRRIQRLEEAGLIDRCVTLLRPAKVGLTVTAFTRVSLERHGEAHNDAFDRAVTLMPEVLECYSVTGPYDYQLRIVAADLAAFAQFMMHRLMSLLHIVNNIVMPAGLWKSYSVYSGAVDAMAQWWYGHNGVAFLLTVGYLAMMYYFVPKQAQRPIYSYRLSIVHFWALISIYMWAGPHHLHYTALPDWAQSVGMVFSVILLAPSWGGAMNGILTLSGVWHKLRTDPILKFLIVAISFYMIATFEGPMLSIKTVNSLSHYTDWTVGHVHAGTLGWVAMISIGSLYSLYPRLLGLPGMYSTKLIDAHFWLHTIGVVFYIVSMWIAGITQGLMWRATNPDGTLTYSFVESLVATYPYYLGRLLGGLMILAGMCLMGWHMWKTWKQSQGLVEHPLLAPDAAEAIA